MKKVFEEVVFSGSGTDFHITVEKKKDEDPCLKIRLCTDTDSEVTIRLNSPNSNFIDDIANALINAADVLTKMEENQGEENKYKLDVVTGTGAGKTGTVRVKSKK